MGVRHVGSKLNPQSTLPLSNIPGHLHQPAGQKAMCQITKPRESACGPCSASRRNQPLRAPLRGRGLFQLPRLPLHPARYEFEVGTFWWTFPWGSMSKHVLTGSQPPNKAHSQKVQWGSLQSNRIGHGSHQSAKWPQSQK